MGLFCYKAPIVERNLSVEDSWHQWIDHEKYRRLGWAVYVGFHPFLAPKFILHMLIGLHIVD